jgi:hypothetical protein
MPTNAMNQAGADHIVPVADMAALLIELINHGTTDLAVEIPLETAEEAGPTEGSSGPRIWERCRM